MATKPATFADLRKSAEKKYNFPVGPLNAIATDTKFITTGNLSVDFAMGGKIDGGVPMGRTVEFYGPPSSGKTTMATHAAVWLQNKIKAGGDEEYGISPNDKILYLDYEQAFDADYARSLGLDPDHESFQFGQPDTLEDGTNFLLDAFRTGEVRLAIIDSVAAMNPSAKAEAEIGKSLPAVAAKLLKDFGVTLNSVLKNNNGTVIFINHEMEKMEMGRRPGAPPATTTPGGVALKFFASVRVQFRQIRQNRTKAIDPITKEEIQQVTSTDVKVTVVKNKVAPPFRQCLIRVRFGRGFDEFWTAMQILLANKQVIYSNGMYYFHNVIERAPADWMARDKKGTKRPYIHGEPQVFAAADEYPEWRQQLVDIAREVAIANVSSLAGVTPVAEVEAEDAELQENDDYSSEISDDELDAMFEPDPNRADKRLSF